MSKLDEILYTFRPTARIMAAHDPEQAHIQRIVDKTHDGAKREIKKLILDLLKESDYDQFEFVDKVSKL